MGLKKNIAYNSLLTVTNYIIPLIVFPYVARILGVENFGIYSFVDSTINYFLIISMLGITTVGIREIAKNKNNSTQLSQTFSSLFVLNSISTFIVLILFFCTVFFVPQFSEQKKMFFIGGGKILFNLFLIEWLYIGTENFKYITIRSIIIRIIYTIAIFIFVRQKEDFDVYYFLTVATLVLNAIVNWLYGRKIAIFSIKSIDIKSFIKPSIALGIYGLLNSFYTYFNVVYLGIVGSEEEVGYYATAIKVQSIFLSLYTAYSSVVMPHISSMIEEKKIEEFKILINKSFENLYLFAIPIVYFSIILAPQIIYVLSGTGYEGAILPMRIVMPLLLIIGVEQILIVQILTPMRQDKAILINSIIGASIGLLLNILLVRKFLSVGSSVVWIISEFTVFISAQYFVNKYSSIKINKKSLFKHLIFGLPYFVICIGTLMITSNSYTTLAISAILCILYFIIEQILIFKNQFDLEFISKFIKKY